MLKPQEALSVTNLVISLCRAFAVGMSVMNVIARKTLEAFWTSHPRAKNDLVAWHKVASGASWTTPAEVLATFPTADVVGDNRIVFNIRGNEFRLVVRVSFTFKAVQVKFVGTHKEYDHINVEKVR